MNSKFLKRLTLLAIATNLVGCMNSVEGVKKANLKKSETTSAGNVSPSPVSTAPVPAAPGEIIIAPAEPQPSSTPVSGFETFLKPFTADSLWNSKPVNPVLGTATIPNYAWYPSVGEGPYSSSIYNAKSTDPQAVITAGDPDIGVTSRQVVIPHFPKDVTPATGSDGHADIVDEATGIIHSFWQLKKVSEGVWTAASYNWMPLRGTGWGTGAHVQAGARAAGVVTMAGMIRKHEIEDGKDKYEHALALSLDKATFLKGDGVNQNFIFPATTEDNNGLYSYSKVDGYAMGSLLMLPANFDLNLITLPRLKKVARTLMTYGAYVVDQNEGTPFAIYVENGSKYSNNPGFTGSWDNKTAAELRIIEKAIRKMVSNSGYVDAEGNPFVANKKVNIMSMRGSWSIPVTNANPATIGAYYDSWKQALVFSADNAGKGYSLQQTNGTGFIRGSRCVWMCKKAGKLYRLKVTATGGARMQLTFKNGSYQNTYASKSLGDGESEIFTMPADNGWPVLFAWSGKNGPSSVSGELTEE